MNKWMIKISFFLFFLFFLIFQGFKYNSIAQQLPVQEKAILIGILPERNIFKQLEMYDLLAEYLSKKIGLNIKVSLFKKCDNIVDSLISGSLDGAFLGSFAYAYAHSRLSLEGLARFEGLDGSSTYNGYIFVRKDSGIKNVTGMKEKVFVFVNEVDTAGYIFPVAYLRENGIKNYKGYFKEFYFSGTHEKAVYDVLNKKADIGAVKNTIYADLLRMDERISDELIILATSEKFPENVLAVRKDLDKTTKEKLKISLLLMHMDNEGREVLKKFGAKRFIEAKDEDYRSVYELAKKANMAIKKTYK